MSSIDGIGGPKGPGASSPVTPAKGPEEPKGAERPFELEQPEAAEIAEGVAPAGDSAVTAALERVAGDLKAGRIPDVRAAFKAVVAEIVEARYPQMAVRQRQQFARHLHDILADDPVLGARITAELERAARE